LQNRDGGVDDDRIGSFTLDNAALWVRDPNPNAKPSAVRPPTGATALLLVFPSSQSIQGE